MGVLLVFHPDSQKIQSLATPSPVLDPPWSLTRDVVSKKMVSEGGELFCSTWAGNHRTFLRAHVNNDSN